VQAAGTITGGEIRRQERGTLLSSPRSTILRAAEMRTPLPNTIGRGPMQSGASLSRDWLAWFSDHYRATAGPRSPGTH
jgi:hypothetical protein